MPRFFFHVHDGASALDEDGTDLPDWRAARLAAIQLAGQILHQDARRVALGEDWRVEVTDDAGLTLFQLAFMIIAAPVVRGDP